MDERLGQRRSTADSMICGGSSCHQCAGPVGERCGAVAQCQPVWMGDRWISTRDPRHGNCPAGPSDSGQCCLGPAGCRPYRSLRAHRRVFVFACLGLAMATILFALFSPWRSEILAPGPLASHHAQALQGEGLQRCNACHPAANLSPIQWLSVAVGRKTSYHGIPLTQSELCLNCHNERLPPETALLPHNVPAEQLRLITDRIHKSHWQSSNWQPVSHNESLACSTCHREHHGAEFNLSELSDQQCQSCHAASFHSFETNHPEFHATYPLRRRPAITFNHGTHSGTHFVTQGKPFDCKLCHFSDSTQRHQLTAGYSAACQSCHDHQIRETDSRGLILLELPILDATALSHSTAKLRRWPDALKASFDGQLSPLLAVLLTADSETARALRQLGPDFDFSRVDVHDRDQVQAISAVANGVVQLIEEWQIDPVDSVRRRLATVLDISTESPQLEAFVRSLPREILASTSDWLAVDTAETKPLNQLQEGESPVVVKPVAQQSELANNRAILAINPLSNVPLANSESISPSDQPPVRIPQQLDLPTDDDPAGTSELLAENPLAFLNQGAEIPSKPAEQLQPASPEPAESITADVPTVASSGSRPHGVPWHADPILYRISYSPQHHSDPLMSSLIDLVAACENKSQSPAIERLFDYLTDEYSAGACAKCHSTDLTGNRHRTNWRASSPTVADHFSKFSHRPHLAADDQNCQSCHVIDHQLPTTLATAAFDADTFCPDFRAITRSDCARCHREGLADNSCVQCHHYHAPSRIAFDPRQYLP